MNRGDLVRWKREVSETNEQEQLCLWCAVPYAYARGNCPHCSTTRQFGIVVNVFSQNPRSGDKPPIQYVTVRFPKLTLDSVIDQLEVVNKNEKIKENIG
tara:strand:+ start:278 stop:574 length:297 start_codon:yes stop_codon:yes gene_type:complete